MIYSSLLEAVDKADSSVSLWTIFLVLGCLAFLAYLFRRFH